MDWKLLLIKLKFELLCLIAVDGTWEKEFCANHKVTVSLNGVKVL